jgi:hypothetical protein
MTYIKRKRGEEPAALSDLLAESEAEPIWAEQIIEPEKPKRKQKPKPHPNRLMIAGALVILFIALTVLGLLLVLVASSQPLPSPVQNFLIAEPDAVEPVPFQSSDPLIDQWVRTRETVGEIAAGTNVRVLSADIEAPLVYNVVDQQGNLSLMTRDNLYIPPDPLPQEVLPPIGPFSDALNRNEKLLVTVEWNGNMPPGTVVYAMGWRAEDGTWIYQVSPDRVRIYYLPAIHLKWAGT